MTGAAPPAAVAADRPRPLVAHILFRFDYGGLENGIVNLVNRLPSGACDHAIIALTEATAFRERISRPGVQVHALGKRPGKDPGAYLRLWRLLRRLRPDIVHTRNIGTLDCALVAWLAGVPVRIHGEHGWDVHDPDGTNPRYLRARRILGHLVGRFVTVSRDLAEWLVHSVGIPPGKVRQICNGVDTGRFAPRAGGGRECLPAERFPDGCIVVGTVSRLTTIKDPLNLVRAFIGVRPVLAAEGHDLRLAVIGDGPLRGEVEEALAAAGMHDHAWVAGSRDDIPGLLRDFDVFVLGSLREGISNTVLEAMASGLPVIASATGGNLELVDHGVSGELVPPGDAAALGQALYAYARDAGRRSAHGGAGRRRVVEGFSLDRMVDEYARLYQQCCTQAGRSR